MRPICPECSRELVFCAVAGPELMVPCWVCDCEMRKHLDVVPSGMIADIMRAREDDDASLVLDLSIIYF